MSSQSMLAGESSGASLLAAKRVAERLVAERGVAPESGQGPNNDVGVLSDDAVEYEAIPDEAPLVVAVFRDSGERYTPTEAFD